ncbi:AMP-binding protein [Streptomyces sp. NPDC046909]|uniref:AMP-binding protein n=1 Tax=Streptomyces sp. NPDC046909 TaxID=3155617 RepID=UPI0033D38E81
METLPDWGTVPRMLRAQAAARPDAVVVSDGLDTLTLSQLRDRATRVARALLASGVQPGDRVAIWAPNHLSWVVTVFGVWDAGAAVVPLSTRAKGYEAGDLLRRTAARVLFVSEGFLGTSYVDLLADVYGAPEGASPFAGLERLELVVSFDEITPRTGVETIDAFLTRADKVDAGAAEERAELVHPGDLCEVLSTSGTTGVPKGVMLGHEQMLRAYWDWSGIADLRDGDRYPVVSPFAHGFGINAGILACVMRTATLLPIALFDPDAALDLVEREQVSLLAGPPTLFARLVNHPELAERNVSSLRVAIVGAAAVPEELVHDMRDRLGLERVINAYGLIEGSVVTMTRDGDPAEIVAATAGRAVPGMEVRIVDESGHLLPARERGEILVRGYGVTQGYWEAPAESAEALAGGWLHTGDVGVLDDAGNLSIVGRKKDMFIAGGFNAYPAEIENLLLRHPDVGQAAVVPVPHPELGEVGCAYVVPESGTEPTADEVIAWARRNMSNYKVPRQVFIVPELPVSANGKIDKRQLRARAATGQPT